MTRNPSPQSLRRALSLLVAAAVLPAAACGGDSANDAPDDVASIADTGASDVAPDGAALEDAASGADAPETDATAPDAAPADATADDTPSVDAVDAGADDTVVEDAAPDAPADDATADDASVDAAPETCATTVCTPIPASAWCDGNTAIVTTERQATCQDTANGPSCTWEQGNTTTGDCTTIGATCQDGACIGGTDPCSPNPCPNYGPQSSCTGTTFTEAPAGPGTCTAVAGNATCAAPAGTSIDCGDLAETAFCGPFGRCFVSIVDSAVEGFGNGEIIVALRTDGSVWRYPLGGEPRHPVSLDAPAVAIASGSKFSCALLDDRRSIRCWGQLAGLWDGAANATAEATALLPTGVVFGGTGDDAILDEVVVSDEAIYVRNRAGTVRAWGGGVANPGTNLGTAARLFAGSTGVFLLDAAGNARHFGSIPAAGRNDTEPTAWGAPETFREITMYQGFGCAVTTSGAVGCFGTNGGRYGVVSDTATVSATPVYLPGITDADDVGVSDSTACATSDGVVRCWGLWTNREVTAPTVVFNDTSEFGTARLDGSFNGFLHQSAVGTLMLTRAGGNAQVGSLLSYLNKPDPASDN